MGKENAVTNNQHIAQYSQNGQRIINECRQQLRGMNVPVWEVYNNTKDNNDKKDTQKESESRENSTSSQEHYTHFSNSANKAYTNLIKLENAYLNSEVTSEEIINKDPTLLSSGRIVETMETIENAGVRHLSFLTETAPEGLNVSGSLNGYYESGSNGSTSIFLGGIENYWQSKNKDIYVRSVAAYGINSQADSQSKDHQNKYVGQISFDGRLEKENFIYGAGVEYNSYSNASQILDIHVSGLHKQTGIGADLTRRTTMTKNEKTGEKATVSSMKLKLDILSNKSSSQTSDVNHFSFSSDSSALPSEVEDADRNARSLISQYIKPTRKNGSDLDFEYTENKCGITYEYNHNFIQKKDKFLSVTPVAGIHDYTDQTLNNNESLELTGGIVTQFGKKTINGQAFTGSVTAITDRIVKNGSRPYDSNYLLASVQYSNSKAKLNTNVDAGTIKSGNISLNYVNLNAEKQMKNSSIALSAGAAKYKIADDNTHLFNVMATYKYTIPNKTKK